VLSLSLSLSQMNKFFKNLKKKKGVKHSDIKYNICKLHSLLKPEIVSD